MAPDSRAHSYLTSPQLEPSHLEVHAPSTFMVWPFASTVDWYEPLTCSGSAATSSSVPVACIPSWSQTSFALTLVDVLLITVVVHSFASASFNRSFSMSSLVTQCFSVVVFVCAAECAFILSSILARCSGESRFSISAGIGIWPALLIVRVLSQRPGLTFRGCTLRAVWESADARMSFGDF